MALSLEQKIARRTEVQEITYAETVEKLGKYGKCIMVRPTGFGKTYLMVKIASNGSFDRMYFVSPRDIIIDNTKNEYEDMLKDLNIEYLSYQKLARVHKKSSVEDVFMEVQPGERVLVMFDEAHFMGADEWAKAISALMLSHPEFFYLGATATPVRTGGENVAISFFDDIKPFNYSKLNAIREGVLEAPYYVTGTFEVVKEVAELANKNLKKAENKRYFLRHPEAEIEHRERLTNTLVELAKFDDLANLFKKYITEYIVNRDYMKFIIFYPNKSVLAEMRDDTVDWFQRAFPDMVVDDTVVVTGADRDKNLEKALKLEEVLGKIDLILCVDMISYGYHVKNLTGVVMFRYTDSNILYNQQIGRCFSIMDTDKKIVFDLVGNSKARPLLYHPNYSTGIDVDGGGIDITRGDGDWDDFVSSEGFINVTEDKMVDVNERAREFDPEAIRQEKAIVAALRADDMNIGIAMQKMGTKNPEVVQALLDRYEGIEV